MKRCPRLFLPLLCLVLLAPAAFAGLDRDPDSMGIYFDTAGNFNCSTLPPFTPANAYLLLANPTAPTGGFACRIAMVGGPYFLFSTDLGGRLDIDAALDGFMVSGATPYPVASSHIVLATFNVMLQSPDYLAFYVKPPVPPYGTCPGPVVFGTGGAVRCCGVSSGDVNLPVAGWNSPNCPVAHEARSFGAIKSLYR